MTADWRGYINLGQADLREVIRAAYDLSGPQGLGILHYREGGLADPEIDAIIERESRAGLTPIVAYMDYVNGRAVKMHVKQDRETGDLYVQRSWYDHSRGALEAFLARFGVEPGAIDAAEREGEAVAAEWQRQRAANAAIAVEWLRGEGGRAANPVLGHARISDEVHDGLHAACDLGTIVYDYGAREYYLPATSSEEPAEVSERSDECTSAQATPEHSTSDQGERG